MREMNYMDVVKTITNSPERGSVLCNLPIDRPAFEELITDMRGMGYHADYKLETIRGEELIHLRYNYVG